MTEPHDPWSRRLDALRVVHDDFETLHRAVLGEIGHPLPPDLTDLVRDWLEVAVRAAARAAADHSRADQ